MISIVATGGANITSIRAALKRLGRAAEVTFDPVTIKKSRHVILPGVGAAGNAMQRLQARGLVDVLKELTQPVLGICLGMQLLFEGSAEESEVNCLAVLKGRAERLSGGEGPVPHMGWNQINALKKSDLLSNVDSDEWFYFVHSYAAPVNGGTVAITNYGQEFASVVEQKNFFGTQFHPERSGDAGSRIFKNFLAFE